MFKAQIAAIIAMIPPMGNLCILALKATSVAALATVAELTFQSYSLNISTSQTLPIYVCVMLFYVAGAQLTGAGFRYAERRIGIWRA